MLDDRSDGGEGAGGALLMRPRRDDARLRRGPGFALRRATAALRAEPDFLVLGAMKAGTSSLMHHLTRHPGVRGPLRKEVHYFTHARRRGRGAGWYRAHFPLRGSGGITGEATPEALYDEDAPGLIRAALPDVRLIAILREPVARAVSHYHHEVRMGRETLPIEAAFAAEEARLAHAAALGERGRETRVHACYRRRGAYAEQIERYLALFPRERLLVLGTGELARDPSAALARAHRFLGLAPAPVEAGAVRNRAPERPPAPPALLAELARWFAPHERRLAALLGGVPDW